MTEETFVRELERRADDVHGVPLTFEDVRGRAHRIRRHRRVAVAVAAAAAVVAIALPTALLSGGTNKSQAPDPAPPSQQGRGAAMLHDGQVTMSDGDTFPIDVDNESVSTFGVLTDGRVVVARNDRLAIQVFSPDGRLETGFPVETTALVMSPTDEAAAWIDENDVVQVLESGAAEPIAVGTAPSTDFTSYMVEAVIGDNCAAGGCRVLVGDGNTTQEVTPDGLRDLDTPEPLRVTDLNPAGNLWSVTFPPEGDGQYGCVGLYDPEAGRVVARNCESFGLTFSPDGQHLVGGFFENSMASDITVLDLDLHIVGRYEATPRVISRAAWADATHVVNVVAGLEDNEWSVVRVGLDGGDPEVVDGPVTAGSPEGYSEFLPSQ